MDTTPNSAAFAPRADASRSLHRFANPGRFLRLTDRWLPWLAGSALLVLGAGAAWGLLFAPPDWQQGETVRIMFVHVPMAWLAMGGYVGLAVLSLMSLIWRHPLADLTARELSLAGAAVTFLCLLTGSLWGKPMWGTWWVWDARLTSVLVLFFLWLGHAALVRAFDDPERGARMGAILALVGAVNVPIVKFSVDWWNTLHQPASVTRLDAPGMHVDILYPLLVCTLGFALAFAAIVLAATRASVMERRVRALQMAKARRAEGALGVSAEGALGVFAEGALGVSAEGALGVSAEGAPTIRVEGAPGVSAEGAAGARAEAGA